MFVEHPVYINVGTFNLLKTIIVHNIKTHFRSGSKACTHFPQLLSIKEIPI